MSELPRVHRPCPECPWRRDTPPGQFPACRYEVLQQTSPTDDGSAGLDIATWAAVRPVLLDRAGGRCEIGGEPVTLATMHGHHRQRREMGDHSCVNGLCLCSAHHLGGPTAVHSHVKDATDHGWIVPTWAHPADRWVLLWDGRIVHLTTDPTIDGGYAVLTTGEH